MTSLNWNHLRVFAAIVDHGGVTRAAQVLGISQSAASQTLQRLEAAMDRRLVRREGRSFILTPVGETIYADIQDMQAAAGRIGLRMGQHRPELRVMIVSNLVSPLLDEAFRLFYQRHPDTLLRVEVRSSHDIVASLREQPHGLGICLLTETLPDLECRFLFQDEWSVFCGVEHPFFGREEVTLEELRGEPFVAFACARDGTGLEPMGPLSIQLGLGRSTSGTSAHVEEVRRMIVSGVGLGLLPWTSARAEVAAGQLWPVRTTGDWLGTHIYLVRPNRACAVAEQQFAAVIEELLPLYPARQGCTPRAVSVQNGLDQHGAGFMDRGGDGTV